MCFASAFFYVYHSFEDTRARLVKTGAATAVSVSAVVWLMFVRCSGWSGGVEDMYPGVCDTMG